MSREQDLQRALHHYQQVTGETEIDMHKVARFAVERLGMKLPPPLDPYARLAKDLSKAARSEVRYDKVTGRPYRANHAVTTNTGKGTQTTFWIDIDNTKRAHMQKSLVQRREQMVGDGVQLSLDADHWNSSHPAEAPIELPMDLSPDIEWAKNGLDEPEGKTGS